MLDPAAQLALVDDCALLRASPIVQSVFDQGTQTTYKMAFCWIEAFRDFRTCTGQSWPVPGDAAPEVLAWLTSGSHGSCPESAWPRGRGDVPQIETDRFEFEQDLGWEADGNGGLTLKWTRLRVDSLVKENAYLPATQLRELFNEWEDLVAQLNLNAPDSLGLAMHISSQEITGGDNKWLHMILQETYVQMALTGLGVGLSIAFVVLLISTQNLIVAFLSIFTIVCSLNCVIGGIVMRGWQLGSAESLSMMILTGFAVDYVVHLSHAYMESRKALPVERVHDALRDLGISVFWGMLTSIISAYVLSTLQLQFFAKFGLFFLLTIIWSYLWAVLFLMPLLAFIGPHGTGPNAEVVQRGVEMASTASSTKPASTDPISKSEV